MSNDPKSTPKPEPQPTPPPTPEPKPKPKPAPEHDLKALNDPMHGEPFWFPNGG